MDKESAKIKIKPKTTPEQLYGAMEQRKMNLSCREVIRAINDIIYSLFGYDELASFDLGYSTKGHLVIYDKKTGESYTASCHFKNKTDQFNPGEIQRLLRMLDKSIKFRQSELAPPEPEETTAETQRFRKVEAKNHGGLDDWFKKEHWVDVSRPKKKGKFQPCGRGDTSKGHKPVCTPANKAKNLSDRERKNRVRQKRRKEKEPNPDKKPNVTKYTEHAGGKSNVSNTNNIRFVGSMIPLSELKPVQPRFIKVSGIEDEGGVGTDIPSPNKSFSSADTLDQMGYNERNFGEEPSPEDQEQYKPFFIHMYFPYYKSYISNILTPMLEDSKYYNIMEFQGALNQKEPEAIKLFLNANEYLAGTSKSRGGSAMAQVACMSMALNAKRFIDAGIDIFNFDNEESSDVEAAWELVSSGNFFEHRLSDED